MYFDESSRQIGVDETNDFMFGELHHALRKQLFDRLGTVRSAIPLGELPPSPLLKGTAAPAQLLGLESTAGLSPNDLENLLKLEAPLAVQARAPRAGFFPFNKFSTVPLLMKAARTAYSDASGNDAKKEFMVLPDAHVVALRTTPARFGTWRVVGVDTSAGFIELAPAGVAVIALGTIENTRIALLSFSGTGIPTLPLMGKNLIGHVRSNLVIRVHRAAIAGLGATTNELQVSALFVKCRAHRANGDLLGHFHLQITATGGGNRVGSEDELFRKIPDIDFFDQLRTSSDTHVAISIRGIGEMAPADLEHLDAHPSRVELDDRTDEFGVRRAHVTLTHNMRDGELWTVMDATMAEVAAIFANGHPTETVQSSRDGLGSTHHETGTLWMERRDEERDRPCRPLSPYREPVCRRAMRVSDHRLAQYDAHGHRASTPHWRSHHRAAGLRPR